jgi:hypothetical protein
MTASDNIDSFIAELADWRGQMLTSLRGLINGADPRLSEDWKWNTPVWTFRGNVCALGAFKGHVKVNFFKGAHLVDTGLFNAGLEAKDSRSIDIGPDDSIDEHALARLVRAATDLNAAAR